MIRTRNLVKHSANKVHIHTAKSQNDGASANDAPKQYPPPTHTAGRVDGSMLELVLCAGTCRVLPSLYLKRRHAHNLNVLAGGFGFA